MQNLNLGDYDHYFKSSAPRSLNSNRIFGGVAVYFKKSLTRSLKLVPSPTPDILWLQIVGTHLGLPKHLYIAHIIVHILPSESTWHTLLGFDLYDRLTLECAQFLQ